MNRRLLLAFIIALTIIIIFLITIVILAKKNMALETLEEKEEDMEPPLIQYLEGQEYFLPSINSIDQSSFSFL